MAVKDTLLTLMEPAIAELGYCLVDVDYLKEGPRWFVRVFIHAGAGVSLEDCQRVSAVLSDLLDERDVVKHAFHLEVSSPGAERVLKSVREYRIFEGRLAKVTLRQPIESGEQHVFGLLGVTSEEALRLNDADGSCRELPLSAIKQVRLALRGSNL